MSTQGCQQFFVQDRVGCQYGSGVHSNRISTQIGHDAAGFPNYDSERCDIENVEVRFDHRIKLAGSKSVIVEKITEGHLQRIVARGIGNPKL